MARVCLCACLLLAALVCTFGQKTADSSAAGSQARLASTETAAAAPAGTGHGRGFCLKEVSRQDCNKSPGVFINLSFYTSDVACCESEHTYRRPTGFFYDDQQIARKIGQCQFADMELQNPVDMVPGVTTKVGTSKITCTFYRGAEACGAPLCAGATFTVVADIIETMAYSRNAPSNPIYDPTACADPLRWLDEDLGGQAAAAGKAMSRAAARASIMAVMRQNASTAAAVGQRAAAGAGQHLDTSAAAKLQLITHPSMAAKVQAAPKDGMAAAAAVPARHYDADDEEEEEEHSHHGYHGAHHDDHDGYQRHHAEHDDGYYGGDDEGYYVSSYNHTKYFGVARAYVGFITAVSGTEADRELVGRSFQFVSDYQLSMDPVVGVLTNRASTINGNGYNIDLALDKHGYGYEEEEAYGEEDAYGSRGDKGY